jgi:glycosyltransferase involved in cell wall biosynthesis
MIDSNPLVSIITPVYNGAAYLMPLIESVRQQDYPHIEHIIIDDGSTDNGETINLLKKYPHLRWWSRENHGQYATMNEGLNAARGEIICFISADDLMTGKAISTVVNWLKDHPNHDAVYGLTDYISKNEKPLTIKYFVRFSPLKYYPYFAHIQHCSLYISKKYLLSKNLIFNPNIRLVGDYDWIIRLLKENIRLGFVNNVLSIIRVHENQISTLNRSEMTKSQYQTAFRHGYGGIKFAIYINILHLLIMAEQLQSAFLTDGIKGVVTYLHHWGKNKLAPFVRQTVSKIFRAH